MRLLHKNVHQIEMHQLQIRSGLTKPIGGALVGILRPVYLL